MFDQIANFQALCDAAQKAAKGKRRKPGVAAFLANLEPNVLRLERELQRGELAAGALHGDPGARTQTAARVRGAVS